METFAPRGKIFGPILPQFVLEKPITFGAKIMYALLCNYASENDHCWPSQATLAERLSCSVSSVKKYLTELVGEKLIDIRREQYRSCVYYLIRPDALNAGTSKTDHIQPKADRQQPKSDGAQPEFGYLNNLNKQEEKITPPLPPIQSNPPMLSPVPRQPRCGGVDFSFHDFEKAWEVYPKKEAMGLARSTWLHLRQNGQLPPLDDLLASIRRFMSTESWQREQGRFIPQMSNWLKGQRWLDALSPADEEKIREQESIRAFQQEDEARKARSKAEGERLRPLFDAFAEKFKNLGKPYGDAMAFGTWRYLYSEHKAPSPSDVPDDNALGIVEFMNAFKRKCDENTYRAARLARAVPTSGNPMSCGEILQASGFLQRLLPQREALCVAV